MPLTKSSLVALEKQLPPFLQEAKQQMDRNYNKYVRVDKYLEKTSDYSQDTLQGEAANAAGDKSKIANTEIAIVHIKHETAHAYLVGTFCTGNPIFAAVTDRSGEDGATMLNTLTGRDQQRLGWVGQISRCLDDSLRRNVCAAEVSWVSKRAPGVKTNVVAGAQKTGAVTPIIYEGVQIKRMDPYNLILDPMVEPGRVHIDGSFVGYVEVCDLVNLKRRYIEWDQLWTFKDRILPILSGSVNKDAVSSGYTKLFRVPQVSKTEQARDPTDFSSFFATFQSSVNVSYNGAYEIVTMYRRIIPEDIGLSTKDLPNSGTPYIFKLVYVNGYLCYAEPMTLGHEYLPIVVGQMYPGDSTKKSFCEYLTDLQDLGTSLLTATLDSMRRAVADRALYDPTRISKAAVESRNPTSKIPVTGNVFQKGLSDAYYQIPYQDNISGMMQQMMQVTFSLADSTTGINPSTQGAFTPGNKTVQEYASIMSNSEARLQLGAVHLENSFFGPVKEMVKLLYFVNTVNGEANDEQSGSTVSIDAETLRNQAPKYMMADGLMPSTKLANTAVMTQAIAMMQNTPELQIEYDTGGIILSILKQQGFNDLNQYKRTPEQQQQYANMVGALNGQPAQPASGQPSAGGQQ